MALDSAVNTEAEFLIRLAVIQTIYVTCFRSCSAAVSKTYYMVWIFSDNFCNNSSISGVVCFCEYERSSLMLGAVSITTRGLADLIGRRGLNLGRWWWELGDRKTGPKGLESWWQSKSTYGIEGGIG